jgi:hypothetical protein
LCHVRFSDGGLSPSGDGRLKPVVGAVRPLAEAPAAFAPGRHTRGKTIIRVTEGG